MSLHSFAQANIIVLMAKKILATSKIWLRKAKEHGLF